MKAESQIRHENLIKFLCQFKQYQDKNGEPTLKIVKDSIPSAKYKNISISDINNAVVVFTDVLNMIAGSSGTFDMYQLMQSYITNETARIEINKIIKSKVS